MTQTELIEIVEDRLGAVRTNQAKEHFHPEIIAFTYDVYYRYYISEAYRRDPYSIDGCSDISYNVPVYSDTNTNRLFSVIPKYVIPFFPVQGGVLDVWKSTDYSVKFEPYSRRFERRNWNRLSINFANTVRWWFDLGVPDDDLSADDVENTTFSDYQSLVWYKANDSQLTNSDTVDMDLMITFYAHGDSQEVYVPSIVGGVGDMIDAVTRAMLSKLGISTGEAFQTPRNQENEE